LLHQAGGSDAIPCRCRLASGHSARITAADLEALLRIALPPLKLTLREPYLLVRRKDPTAAAVAAEELVAVERIRARLARDGWWS
jgi:hypothetical protein